MAAGPRPSRSPSRRRSRNLAAFIGIVAGFWHITWVAGVVMLVAGLVATLVHSAGYVRLEVMRKPTP